MLLDGKELALLDVREEGVFSDSHLLFASSLPLSGSNSVSTRWCPAAARESCCATTATGWRSARRQDSPISATAMSRFSTAAPAHGNARATFCSAASTSRARRSANTRGDLPHPEHNRRGAEVAARRGGRPRGAGQPPDGRVPAHEHPDRDRRAGRRTRLSGLRHRAVRRDHGGRQLRRSDAEHHRRPVPDQAGIPNPVMALRNGTMGWELAGFTQEARQRAPAPAGQRRRPRPRPGRRRQGGRGRGMRPSTATVSLPGRPRRTGASVLLDVRASTSTRPVTWPVRGLSPAVSSCRRPTR